MDDGSHASAVIGPETIPGTVRSILDRLLAAGHEAYLVGGCVRDLLLRARVHDYDIATSASPSTVLELFPRAVPIGLRHGTVMVPTASGPVDVTTFRFGHCLEDDLAHRDFTLGAMALDVRTGALVDPSNGRKDLATRRLRAVGSAADRFAEDPLRTLRAARLAACFDLAPDPEIEPAMAGARRALGRVAAERIQHELARILLSPHPARGLGMLRRSGIEADLAPGVREDAHRVVAALPWDLDVRLAGWLRGTSARSILYRLRFSRRICERVARLVDLHPIERQVRNTSEPALRRLLRRAGETNLMLLLALRTAELNAGAESASDDACDPRARLDELHQALDRARARGRVVMHRSDLALGGREIMDVLGCSPGPHIGRALDYLSERVLDEPSLNTPEGLRSLLEDWQPLEETP